MKWKLLWSSVLGSIMKTAILWKCASSSGPQQYPFNLIKHWSIVKGDKRKIKVCIMILIFNSGTLTTSLINVEA